jgi:tetratricopeptide (TPR) repeat protein
MIRTAFVLAAALAVAPIAAAQTADDAINAGIAAFKKRRFAAAEEQFAKAVEAEPNSAAAHFYLGYTIYKIAEPRTHDAAAKRESLEHFAEAFRLDPQFKPNWRG